ncbi:hypothetical protein J19TS1_02280 [Heyndrickxia oleronia]|nr:hypothetical protein J19TS1_02280 [Heyndrickxia oleronia]
MKLAAHELNDLNELTLSCVNSITKTWRICWNMFNVKSLKLY